MLLLYLALNVVYALALSAADIRGIVDDPANRSGSAAVAPIAEIAATRLFGPRWTAPLSIAAGLMLLSSLSAYLLIGPRVLYAMAQAGQFPAIAARLTPRASTPGVATAFQIVVALDLALGRLAAEHHRIRRRRPVDLLDAGDELDLHPPPQAARPAAAIPHARISGHAGDLPGPHRRS